MHKKNKKDWINYQSLYRHLKNEKRELKNMDILDKLYPPKPIHIEYEKCKSLSFDNDLLCVK